MSTITITTTSEKKEILTPEAYAHRREMIGAVNGAERRRVQEALSWERLHAYTDANPGVVPMSVESLETFVAETLSTVTARSIQFTADANRRVDHSKYEVGLRRVVFDGKSEVTLLEVELAICFLDVLGGGKTIVDGSELATCVAKIPGCVGTFLPRKKPDSKPAFKELGNYSPNLEGHFGEKSPVCVACRGAVQDREQASKKDGADVQWTYFLSSAACDLTIAHWKERREQRNSFREEREEAAQMFVRERTNTNKGGAAKWTEGDSRPRIRRWSRRQEREY